MHEQIQKRSPEEGNKQLTFHWHAYSVFCCFLFVCFIIFILDSGILLPSIDREDKKEKGKEMESRNTCVISQCIFE